MFCTNKRFKVSNLNYLQMGDVHWIVKLSTKGWFHGKSNQLVDDVKGAILNIECFVQTKASLKAPNTTGEI